MSLKGVPIFTYKMAWMYEKLKSYVHISKGKHIHIVLQKHGFTEQIKRTTFKKKNLVLLILALKGLRQCMLNMAAASLCWMELIGKGLEGSVC